MMQTHDLQDSDRSLLHSMCDKFAQALNAGISVSIETTLDAVPAGLRDTLLTGLLPIEVKHLQNSGAAPEVESYLAKFPERKEVVLWVFAESNTVTGLNQLSAPGSSSTQDDEHTRTIIASGEELADADTLTHIGAIEASSEELTIDSILPVYPDGQGYIVEQEIDRGGMGVVLKVRDENLHRTLALKVIRGQELTGGSSKILSDQGILARFVREAQVTGQLDHPGVVPIHELATDREGRMYFTMKYIQGKTLSKVIPELQKNSTQWNLTRVLEVLIRVCETLAFAHSKNVIHRDLKPPNIMVGEFGEAYVMDWGLAKILGETEVPVGSLAPDGDSDDKTSTLDSRSQSHSQTMYGDVVGTAYYMPPEQAAGRIDELDQRTDVYSVGAVLYEILTGQSPYREGKRPGNEIISDVLAGPPKPIRTLRRKAPPELVAICEKAMSRRMEDRYSSIAKMADDLRAYLSQRVVSAYQTGFTARLRKWITRNQIITIAGLLTLATIASALGIVALLQSYSQKEIEGKNQELSKLLIAKDQAIAASEAAARKEKLARDEVNGLSLMNRSKNVLVQGDATLATLLALESVARFPTTATMETLYSATAELDGTAAFELTSRCRDLAWSPDGRRLLAVGNDGTGVVWDVETSKVVAVLVNSQEQRFSTAVFSNDGRSILTAGAGGSVALYNADTGVRELAIAVGMREATALNANPSRPNIINAEFCIDVETGAHEARIVAASETGALYLFERRTGRELAILRSSPETAGSLFREFAVSPDGRSFVVGCEDGHVYLWKDQQELLKAFETQKGPIQDISFSSDGKFFITTAVGAEDSGDRSSSSAYCWHTVSGELHSEISPNGLQVRCAEFHPTRSIAALGLSDQTLCLWDVENQKVMAISKPCDELISQLDFWDNGDQVVAVSEKGELMSWVAITQPNMHSLSAFRRLSGDRGKIDRMVRSPSGMRVASGAGSEVRIWNSDFQYAVPTLGSPTFTSFVHLARRGDRLFEVNHADRKGRLWSYPEIKFIRELSAPGGSSAEFLANNFTADDLHVAASFTDGWCRLWDSRTGELQFETQFPEPPQSLTCNGSRLCITSAAGASVWDWKTGVLCGQINEGDLGNFHSSPDGRFLFGQNRNRGDGPMSSFDVAGDLSILKQIPESGTCGPSGFSESGRYFWCHGTQSPHFSVAISSYVSLIDAETGNLLFATQGDGALVRSVFVNNSDTQLLVEYTQGTEFTAEIYSIPDGAIIGRLGPPEGAIIDCSTDLHFAALKLPSGDVQLWNTSTHESVGRLEISGSTCKTVCFSPDNQYVMVQHTREADESENGTDRVSLWSTQPFSMISMIPGENQSAFRNGFFPDGKSFWTVTAENQIRVWPLDVAECARQHVSRSLTADEQRMYGVDEIRQIPNQISQQFPARRLQWNALSDQISLLSPVTSERRNSANRLLAAVEIWLNEEATQEEITSALNSVELLRTGLFDTDPTVLAKIAELHEKFGEQGNAVQILELAVRHPRAEGIANKLSQARSRIAPRLISLRSADAVAEAAFQANASTEDVQSFVSAMQWAAKNSPLVAAYLTARRLRFDGHPEKAQSILQRVAHAELTASSPEAGPELFLQLAECDLELGQVEAAAKILRSALNEERFRAPEVWNRWLQISFAKLELTPQQLITQLPEKTSGVSPEPRHEDSVAWLLDTLSNLQPLRINCGGDRYVSADETVWESDRLFTHGLRFFESDGDATLFAEPIADTQDPYLFQSERWFSNDRPDQPAGYQIPVPNGVYEVTLGFAEIYEAERSFDVLLEGKPELTEYDPGSGAWATAEKFVLPTVVTDGQLDVTLIPVNIENPKISCIQIVPVLADSNTNEK